MAPALQMTRRSPGVVLFGEVLADCFPDGERAGGTARTTLMPLRLDGQRMGVRLDPPRLGQHTQDLLAGLGYTADQVAALRACAAVA